VYELMENRHPARVLLSPADIGRPIVGAPGTPADQTKLLRTAFLKALSDAAFGRGWEARPIAGEEFRSKVREK
jgi:hypothetical protein